LALSLSLLGGFFDTLFCRADRPLRLDNQNWFFGHLLFFEVDGFGFRFVDLQLLLSSFVLLLL